jgi:hypothetical protein
VTICDEAGIHHTTTTHLVVLHLLLSTPAPAFSVWLVASRISLLSSVLLTLICAPRHYSVQTLQKIPGLQSTPTSTWSVGVRWHCTPSARRPVLKHGTSLLSLGSSIDFRDKTGSSASYTYQLVCKIPLALKSKSRGLVDG